MLRHHAGALSVVLSVLLFWACPFLHRGPCSPACPVALVHFLQLQECVTAIKAAMTWDEAAFGREYDLVSTQCGWQATTYSDRQHHLQKRYLFQHAPARCQKHPPDKTTQHSHDLNPSCA